MSFNKINEKGYPVDNLSFDEWMQFYTQSFEEKLLQECSNFNEKYKFLFAEKSHLTEAMQYSLSAGGKRIRPILCLEFNRVLGGDLQDALSLALAIEMIHTFSLIHDDLPCMDDDDYRRGRLSCHKAFDEATALLAGDALQSYASMVILSSTLEDKQKSNACMVLCECCYNMICGQSVDVDNGQDDINSLYLMYKNKTSELLTAACVLGCISANSDENHIEIAKNYAFNLGIAFQIVDDILDVIGNAEELGKPIGSDSENNKQTAITFLGIDGAISDADKFTANALDAINKLENNSFLVQLTQMLLKRKK